MITRNGWTVAIVTSVVYVTALGIGLRHVHLANTGIDRSSGECVLVTPPPEPAT